MSHITPIITYIQLQQYFALTNDFAYTNLSEMRLESIHFGDSMFFKNIYENLYTNKYLTDTEKRNCYFDLFDRFRMSGHNRNIYFFDDITNYHWEFKKTKEKKYPPCILGQATSSLLLSVLLNKDEHNFNLFSQMNIEQEEMEYAIHTMFLTLIKIEEEKQYENIYCDYYKLDIKWCKKFLHSKLEFLFNPKENSPYKTYSILKNINKSYNYITEVCNDNFETNKKYRFLGNHLNKYDIDMISIYFEKLSKIYKIKNVDIKNYKNIKLEKAIEKWLK